MAFDGVVIKSLADELKNTLVGGRIEKVHQPEKDEISLKIRTREDNYKLVISASASTPMIYISENHEKINPKKAPIFCMTLRKHIQGGIISDIKQVGFERVIKISVEGYDELREKSIKSLYIEIMGKHSNIILVNDKENKIIDSIKRIPLSVSSVRQVLPGNIYELPPKQDKINPLEKVDEEVLEKYKNRYIDEGKNMDIYKYIYMSVLGISPIISKKICFDSNIEANKKIMDLSRLELNKIAENINTIIDELNNGNISPNIVIDKATSKIIEYSSVKLSQYEDDEVIYQDSVSKMIEKYYFLKDKLERINQRTQGLRKSLNIKYERVVNKIKKQEKELENSLHADEYKKLGELVTAYIYKIKQGDKEVVVEDFYDNNKEIKIKLKENLSPSENAQKYFKKYTKLKNAFEELTILIEENKSEKEYLENTILSIDNCSSLEELKEIREELMREGYIKTTRMPKKNIKPTSNMMKYYTSNSNIILVGKNNKQNDYLTLKLADNEDMWFHTKDIPGSHVLLKCAGRKPDEKEIIEAATLAAYYSKGKMSQNVAVDYTLKKNVKKPGGAKPGLVIYEKNRTIYVTPSDEEVAKIKREVLDDEI